MSTTIERPGLYPDLPAEDYHRDPVPGGSLSASGAKLLLPPSSPAHYRWAMDHPQPFKRHFSIGTAAHQRVLGVGPELVVIDAENYRTKTAQAERDEAHANGLVPLLAAEMEQVDAMTVALMAHPIAGRLLDPDHGKPEQSLFWRDDRTGVIHRCRLDWLPDPSRGRMIIPDYKTARSAHPDTWAKAAADHGYHLQDANYRAGVQAVGLADKDVTFVFIVQEKEPPYVVSVIELDQQAVWLGRDLMHQASSIYAECKAEGRWPGYSDRVEQASLPTYYTRLYEQD